MFTVRILDLFLWNFHGKFAFFLPLKSIIIESRKKPFSFVLVLRSKPGMMKGGSRFSHKPGVFRADCVYRKERKMKRKLFFTIALPACFLLVSGFAFPEGAEKKRAIVPFDTPDPTVIEEKDGSGFYAFTTVPGINILHSEDLLQWNRAGKVFPNRVPDWALKSVPGSRGIWAPDISYFNGLYHLYYSVSTFGGQRSVIGLAVNKTLNPNSPEYRWEDRGLVLESDTGKTDYNAIDSALFVDEDGKTYLYWGSYWSGLKAVEVDSKTGLPYEYESNRSDGLKVPANYVPVAARSPESKSTAIEAPFVVKKDKFYYLFVSWDSCCDSERSTYKIAVGRSEKPLGPFVDAEGKSLQSGGGTLLLESTQRWKGTGHNGFLKTEKGDWIILAAYDARNPKLGRLTQIRPVYWTSDAWIKIGPILDVPYQDFDFSAEPGDPRAE